MFDVRRNVFYPQISRYTVINSDPERSWFSQDDQVSERLLAVPQSKVNQSENQDRKDLTHNPSDLTAGETATETP